MNRMLFTSTRSRRGPHSGEGVLRDGDSATAGLLDAAQKIGYETEVGPVSPGQDLTAFDAVVVTLTNAGVQGNTDLYGALWAIAQSWHSGAPVLVNFDHWTLKDIIKSYQTLAGRRDKLWDGFIEYPYRDRAMKVRSYIDDSMDRMFEGQWPQRIVPAWAWGDHELLNKGLEGTSWPGFTYRFDPSYLHLRVYDGVDYRLQPGEARERRWVLGAVSDHSSWTDKLDVAWPIERYGWIKGGQQFMDRDWLIKRYRQVWGGLSPPYYHAGSGYWRARLVHYSMAGCITLTSAEEVSFNNYDIGDIADLELMSDKELREIALNQHLEFISCIDSEEETLDHLEWVFENLTKGNAPAPEYLEPDPQQDRLL